MQQPLNNPYYFEFDELIHYCININEAALEELEFKKEPTGLELLLQDILFKNHPPKNLSDIKFIESLEELGFIKKIVETQNFAAINDLFKVHNNKNIDEPYCGAVYRDVLIFYNQSKIIGIAKLCFSCGHFHIVGTEKDTSNFSSLGALKKLHELLKNN